MSPATPFPFESVSESPGLLKGISRFAWIAWSLPWVFFALTYMMLPGYIVPFLNHPITRVVLIGSLAWETLGAAFLCRFNNIWARSSLICFFVLPSILLPVVACILLANLSCGCHLHHRY